MQGDGARELARFSKEAVGVLRTTENEHGGGSDTLHCSCSSVHNAQRSVRSFPVIAPALGCPT